MMLFIYYTWDHYILKKKCPKVDYKSTASYNDS